MAESPFLIGIKRRFGRPPPAENGGYQAFTKAFDQVVDAADLPDALRKQTPEEGRSFNDAVERFDKTFSGERITIGAAAAKLVRDIRDSLSEAGA